MSVLLSVVKTEILACNYSSLKMFFVREVLSVLLSAVSETCIFCS